MHILNNYLILKKVLKTSCVPLEGAHVPSVVRAPQIENDCLSKETK